MSLNAKTGKERVTVSVDAELLGIVDSYVREAKEAGVSRSSIFEHALHLWKEAHRDVFDERYYAQNARALKDDNWTTIGTEAARRIWRE